MLNVPMSLLTPHRPAASSSSCASPDPSPLLRRLGVLLVAAGLGGGCYTGPADAPDTMPWQGDDDASGGDAEGSDGNEAGDGMDGGTGADGGGSTGGDAGDAGDTGDTGDAGDSSSDAGDTNEPPPVDVPDNPYCEEVASWDPAWVQLELDVLELVNQHRANGANCGSEGSFGPAPALTMNPALRCAARKHSKDMNDRMFFDHVNPSGESPWDRMQQAGYSYSAAGENIAGGSPDAAGTMNQWMESDGHCANIMNPSFEEIGVGYYPGGQWGHLWTQAFGAQ